MLHNCCEKGQVSGEKPPLGGSHGHPQLSLDSTIVFSSTFVRDEFMIIQIFSKLLMFTSHTEIRPTVYRPRLEYHPANYNIKNNLSCDIYFWHYFYGSCKTMKVEFDMCRERLKQHAGMQTGSTEICLEETGTSFYLERGWCREPRAWSSSSRSPSVWCHL